MPRRSPDIAAQRWARSMANAGTNYTEGVNSVTTAPGQAAARQVNAYQAGVAQAVSSGKWQNRVQSVSLEDWKRAAVQKGAARLSQGAAAAVDKVRAANERTWPMIEAAQARVAQMPRTTTAERIARSQAYQIAMHEIATQRAGR